MAFKKVKKQEVESDQALNEIFGDHDEVKTNPNPPARSSRRNMKKVTRPTMFEFDEIGIVACGTILGITEGETQFGPAEFLQLIQDDGEKISVCISSALALYDWEELTGKYVEIEYTGEEKSKKNKGKTFKTFEISSED